MITLPEAARRAGRNQETIRRWIRTGRLPARRVGAQQVINETDLRAMVENDTLPLPAWMRHTLTGEPMPNVVAALRRQRAGH